MKHQDKIHEILKDLIVDLRTMESWKQIKATAELSKYGETSEGTREDLQFYAALEELVDDHWDAATRYIDRCFFDD